MNQAAEREAGRAWIQQLESRVLLSMTATPAAASAPAAASTITVSPFVGETGYNSNVALTRLSTWSLASGGTGTDLWDSTEPSSALDMKVVGSSLTLHYIATASGAIAYSVDSAASVTPTLTAGADTALTINLGTDGTHTIHFDLRAANPTDLELEAGIQLTGAAPATLQPDHFGAQYALDPTPGYIAAEGGWQTSSNAGNPYLDNMPPGGFAYPDESLTFHANGSELWAWVQRTGGTLHLSVDGQSDATPIAIPNAPGGTWGWVQVGSGLNTSAEHEYRLSVTATGIYGQPPYGTYLGSLMVVGGAMDTTFSSASRSSWAFYGDSITMANGFQPYDSAIGYAHKLGLQYDVGVINRAISGNSVQNQGFSQTANLTGLGVVPSKLFIMYGTNDMGPAGNGSTPTAQFKSDFVTMLNDFLAAPGWGATQVYVIGITPRVNFSAATITAWNGLGNGIQGAIAACQNPGRVTFVDPTDWGFTGTTNNDYSTYYTTDGAANGVHPNAAGFNLMVSKLAPYIAQKTATSGSGGPASATFVRNDSTTQGNWIGAYGADGYDVIGSNLSLPNYARLSAAGQGYWLWSNSENNAKDLQVPGSSARIAACDYTTTSMTLDVNLTDGNAHQVALYFLDWENAGRTETVQVSDASSGAVLDTEQVGSFAGGRYLAWNLSGHVTITITNTGPNNAVLSGVMFDPIVGAPAATAKYVATNTTTGGTWTGVYGADGYSVVAGQTSLPAYASLATSGASTYTWSTSAADGRNLQVSPGSSSRVAACDVSATSFTLDLNLTDGKTHQVELYALNWDSWSYRNETFTVTDANTGAVLDTRNVSNFGNGQWLVWDLSGHVKITVANNGGMNAVLSGILFDPATTAVPPPPPPPPAATATFVANDATTEGAWTNVYGGDGYSIMGGATSLPSYATLSVANAQSYTWFAAGSTTDARDLQTAPGAATRIAACEVSATSFTFDLNLTDGKAHQVELYALNWDSWTYRNETFTVSDASTGAVLDTRNVANFGSGQWLVWDLSGHVKITVTNNGGVNAVVSGLFFGGPPAASAGFVRADTTTGGTWTNVYGADGYSIVNGTTALPSYAQLATSGAGTWTWSPASSTSDTRDLQTAPGAATRIAACDVSPTSFTFDLNLTDGKSHQIDIYALNWDSWTYRNETFTVTDANTGAVLDTRSVSNFGNGQWLVWNMTGHVKITVANNGGMNAVASGLFFA